MQKYDNSIIHIATGQFDKEFTYVTTECSRGCRMYNCRIGQFELYD